MTIQYIKELHLEDLKKACNFFCTQEIISIGGDSVNKCRKILSDEINRRYQTLNDPIKTGD